ncbi:electron transport complex subunit G [Pseudomonas solani]|uniref:Electron transport complex subunit G n=1 Tax=Pseudomonas solani TaxID=2731552 RepID=A0AAU7Y691_9PSED|nr:RnfABCDGE type electron transport complex subunit G [Pseudomonas solani]BCD87103.1 electron transport complex subunit G [Pseudomonas solani]
MNGRSLVVLLALGLGGLALLVASYQGLGPQITAAAVDADERALLDLLPPGSYDNHPLREPIALPDAETLGRPAPTAAWLARREGKVVALLLPVTAAGYEGPIRLLLAIAPDGRLLRSKVLEHRETAGIGDRIEPARSPWLASLEGVSPGNRPGEWRVKADGGAFDQIAGATITSRAVVAATQQGLRYFDAHREQLLGDAP